MPPDVLTPVLRQLVDQFVHDRARPEVMSLGLKTVRSLCERTPLVMTPELLQVTGFKRSPQSAKIPIRTSWPPEGRMWRKPHVTSVSA